MDIHISRSLNRHLLWKSLGLGVNLIITILIARFLEASVSGQFFYFLSWMSLLVLTASLSLDSSITYFLASKKMIAQHLSAVALIWIFFVLCLFTLIGFIYGDSIRLLIVLPADGILLGLCFIAGQLMINYFTAFFYGEHKFVLPAKLLFFSSIFYMGFLLFYASENNPNHLQHKTIITSYVYLILIQGIAMMLAVLFSKNAQPLSFVFDMTILKQLFLYSSIAFSANILFFLATRIDYWLLNHFHTDAIALGNYIQVSRIVQLFQLFPSLLAAFIFPLVASKKEKMIPYLIFLCRIILLLDLLCVLILGFFGGFLFPFIFGESFRQMHQLFLLLIPGIFALSILAVLSAYFAGVNKVSINMLGSLAALVTIAVLNYFLIPLYDVKAAAVVSSIGYTVCVLVAFYFLKRNINIRIKDLLWINFAEIKNMYKIIMN